MSITFTNARKLSTASTTVPWGNQSACSLAFFWRYDGDLSAAVLNTIYPIYHAGQAFYLYTQAVATAGAYSLRFNLKTTPSGGVSLLQTFNAGTAYHFAVVHSPGHQILYVNGIAYPFGTKSENTDTLSSNPWSFGSSPVNGTPFVFTMHDFAMWNGYALTPGDVAGLRDGSLLPPAVGGSASWRGRWTMAGTAGATVALGDAGIANDYGDTAYDLKAIAGTGTAVYSAPLIFEPAALSAPKVMTSGKTIGFTFNAIAGGAQTIPLQALIDPTVKINGVSVGTLINPWLTGQHPILLYAIPPGHVVGPADTVTVAAPAAWCNTKVGITGAMVDLPATNCAGRSAFGVDTMPKTFRPGTNNAHLAFQNATTYCISKNWRLRCPEFTSGTTVDASGRPLSNPTWATISASFFSMGPQTGTDQTMSFPSGLWAVGWDDTNPSSPTTLGLLTFSSSLISIVEHPEYNNPGVGGVGIVRVFDVQQISTVAAGGNTKVDLQLSLTNAAKTFRYANDVVYGPGDFTPGTPTVLDRSDPYAISASYLQRLGNGVGSLRFIDSLWEYGGYGAESEPEQAFRLSDYSWGLWQGKINNDAFCTQIRPWNPAVTPWIYTTLFGSPYNATLASPIDAVATVLSISDAATAPVIIGLRLKVDSELMRVLSISGTSVTVERGTCGTAAAAHAAGTIQVQNRWDANAGIPSGQMFEIVASSPHKANTGQTLGAYGAWPAMDFTDGSHVVAITGYYHTLFVTGPNTVLMLTNGTTTPRVTVSTTYSLDPACKLGGKWPGGPAIPVEYAAKLCSHFDGCKFHFSLPHATSDSLAWAAWKWVLDNTRPDIEIRFEYSNEPWNFYFHQYEMLLFISQWLYPATKYGWEFYIQRVGELVAIGKAVWSAAGRDPSLIKGMLNTQKNAVSNVSAQLEFAHTTLGKPIDLVALATYIQTDTSTATQAAFWQYDDDQANDLLMADFRTNPTSYPAVCAAMNSGINAYNAKYGAHVKLLGYEGGISRSSPAFSTTLSVGIDAATTSVPVASVAGLVAGIPMLCGSEWMAIVSIAGNTLTVTRGAYGSTAVAHANAVAIRTAYIERSHDLIYNPLTYYFEQEHYAVLQDAGFDSHNTYTLSMGAAESGTYYGMYHIQTQQPGYGDGSGGGADNRLTLVTPGKPHSKAVTVDQDAASVSVRGQAFLDWMLSSAPPVARKPPRALMSYRRRK